MQRFTISLDEELADEFDHWIRHHGYENRSEALRDLIRDRLARDALNGATAQGSAVACVSYVYDHHQREVSRRLTSEQHRHHDLTVSTLHVHLDADRCLEISVLKGDVPAVRAQAEGLIAERGVQHGQVHLLPLGALEPSHGHH